MSPLRWDIGVGCPTPGGGKNPNVSQSMVMDLQWITLGLTKAGDSEYFAVNSSYTIDLFITEESFNFNKAEINQWKLTLI